MTECFAVHIQLCSDTDFSLLSQDQVDNGIPLRTCLYLFGRWIEDLRMERGVVLLEPGKEFSEELALCALVTWSGENKEFSEPLYMDT